MKRTLSSRSSHKKAEQGSANKRQKTNASRSEPAPQYSTRDVPWDEQRKLGGDFLSVGEGSWPISHIQEERGFGKSLKYLVVWRPHPERDEQWEPEWKAPQDVNDDDIQAWERKKSALNKQQEDARERRRARQRRVVPTSSSDFHEALHQSDAPSPPSLHTGSSDSEVEIPETQYPTEPLQIIVPPLPKDENKSDYVLLESSQDHLSSPISRVAVTSSQSQSQSQSQSRSQAESDADRASSRKSPRNLTTTSVATSTNPRSKPWRTIPKSALGKTVALTQDLPDPDTSQSEPPVQEQATRFSSPFHETPSSLPNLGNDKASTQGYPVDTSRNLTPPIADEIPDSQSSPVETPFASPLDRQLSFDEFPSHQPEFYSDPIPFKMASRGLDLLTAADAHTKSPLSQAISADELAQDPPLFADDNPDDVAEPQDIGAVPLIIQESIEDDNINGASNILDSKANSSQESLNNEREIETVDGVMIPALPILGPSEYAIALPAEGKVKSAYDEVIKVKKKSILRFIGRKGSPGTADISNKKTLERIEMQDMLQRLCDTTTHADLGLPATQQYEMNHEHNAAYAEYAGSKFTLLGYLIDQLKASLSDGSALSFVVFAQEGPLLDLLEEFLGMKQVATRRHSPSARNEFSETTQGLSVDLLPSQAGQMFQLLQKPAFIIAFDVSFAISDPQVSSLRQHYGQNLPVVHLLITNSAEHVERCVPVSLTSNIRLKVVVRTAYLAAPFLGGEIAYIPDPSDQPADGRPMDMSDLQRAVRKSPNRRMQLIADIVAALAVEGNLNEDWSVGGMPELKLAPLDTPPKNSRAASRTPQPRRARTQTPASRATTPVGRKRLLDVDGENGVKRIRLTPNRDVEPKSSMHADELVQARKEMSRLTEEVASLRNAVVAAEAKQAVAEQKAEEWQESHATLMRRYEKGRESQRELSKTNKKLTATVAALQVKEETARIDKSDTKQQISDLKAELSAVRGEIKAAGGDRALLEEAREEARSATAKLLKLEKSAKSNSQDFEFMRAQYQDASKQAVDLAAEVRLLESQVEALTIAAGDNKRALKAMNYEASLNAFADRAEAFSFEVKSRNALIKRLHDEIAALKSRRGVQTRGSSVQPATSPAPRSRQASPAAGIHLMPPSGSRTSVLRNER